MQNKISSFFAAVP